VTQTQLIVFLIIIYYVNQYMLAIQSRVRSVFKKAEGRRRAITNREAEKTASRGREAYWLFRF
jgi:hypothetical protein